MTGKTSAKDRFIKPTMSVDYKPLTAHWVMLLCTWVNDEFCLKVSVVFLWCAVLVDEPRSLAMHSAFWWVAAQFCRLVNPTVRATVEIDKVKATALSISEMQAMVPILEGLLDQDGKSDGGSGS